MTTTTIHFATSSVRAHVCSFAFVAWAVFGSAAHSLLAGPIQTGLVAHYAFEEVGQTVNDGIAPAQNGFLGTSAANATSDPARTTGFIGSGLDFENSSTVQTVTMPASNQYISGASAPVSIAAWVNVESFAANIDGNRIFTLLHSGGGSTFSMTLGNNISGMGYLGLAYNNGSGFLTAAANTSFATGAWHHVAATYNGTTVRFYLDGAADGNFNTAIQATGTPAAAMGAFPGPSSGFDGLLDDVGLWTRALDANEVLLIYQNGLLGTNLANAAAFPPVPEPSSLLLVAGTTALVIRRRRRAIAVRRAA